MQTNNHTLLLRKFLWLGLWIGVVGCVICIAAVVLSFFSGTYSNTYRLGMLSMGAFGVLNFAGQLCLSYGRTRLAIVLLVLGGISAITAIVTLGSFFIEFVR